MNTLGGVPVERLAQEYQTPALVIDFDRFDADLLRILSAARRNHIGVSYAAKALLLVGIAQRLAPHDVGIDVASLGELVTAERGGIEASRITMHGAGKTDDELDSALDGRVARLVIDSAHEATRLIARANGRTLNVLLRINTGIEAHTHEFIRTAGDDSKFGLSPSDLTEVMTMLRRSPNLVVRGVHSHIGSQIMDAAPFVANAEYLAPILARMRAESFLSADTIVIGGGFGVQMDPRDEAPPLDVDRLLAQVAQVTPAGVRVEIEPGRAIVARAGTTLYRVAAIKRFDRRTFVIIDGSMADNPRPALYDAYHHFVACRPSSAPSHRVTIAGRSCENDEMGSALVPTDLAPGDLIAMEATGAYTYSMASNYNRFSKPPVVGVAGGTSFLLARRQTLDDVLGCDAGGEGRDSRP